MLNNNIKKYICLIALLNFFWIGKAQQTNENNAKVDLAQYVDPMIGTAKMGHTYPGVLYILSVKDD